MCNQNDEIEDVIEDVPMWSTKAEADQLLSAEIAAQPVEDDGCEIGEDGEKVCPEEAEEAKAIMIASKFASKHHAKRHMKLKVQHRHH
jgi:hypothetical protein